MSAVVEEPKRRAYRIDEFCSAFRVSRGTAYKLVNEGKLPLVKVAGRSLIPADAAEALLRPRAELVA